MNDEEKLAREAVVRIRAWAGKRAKAHGGDSSPRLAIRFCGGCNPCLEREALAQMLRQGLTAEIQWVTNEEGADLLLIINGCPTACADRPEILDQGAENLIISGTEVSEVKGKGRG